MTDEGAGGAADPPGDPPGTPPSRLRSAIRRVGRWLGIFLTLLVVGLAAGAGALLYPYLRDDWRLDAIARAVALDWRDFGRARADERLRYEIDAQGLGQHVRPSDCVLDEAGEDRVVRCAWAVRVRLGAQVALPLAFESVATVTSTGDLR